MSRQRCNPLAAMKERERMQKEIIEKFGEEAILEARKRLCKECFINCSFLLPLTTEGRDCPYFKQKEAKNE